MTPKTIRDLERLAETGDPQAIEALRVAYCKAGVKHYIQLWIREDEEGTERTMRCMYCLAEMEISG